jgi:hypothetical protein
MVLFASQSVGLLAGNEPRNASDVTQELIQGVCGDHEEVLKLLKS